VVDTSQTPRDDDDWGSKAWPISGEAGNSATLTLGRVVIKAGMSNPRHGHDTCDELLYLLSGEIEHYADDLECVRMKPGDVISIPSGVFHNAKCVGEGDAEMIVVYSTAERDFVPAE
ncbi:MAG TPA: cupin domain-containing protein, partial [Armatimonadota bacterium]|nr:cupin domain-containing protein [Armatimonadota bacterium]